MGDVDDVVPAAIRSATKWRTNGDLIADLFELGLLREDLPTLDPTYGSGGWWTKRRPTHLTTRCRPEDGSDYRSLTEFPDESFAQIAYDPQYAATGGKGSVDEFIVRYGRDVDANSPESVQQLINDGLTEMWRLVEPARLVDKREVGGIVIVKCMDYTWNAKLWEGTYFTRRHAESLGFELADKFTHVGDPGPQPKRSRCLHCGHPIQRRRSLAWARQGRTPGVDNVTCPDSPTGHAPTPGLRTQRQAAQNASLLYAFRKPTRGRANSRQTALL